MPSTACAVRLPAALLLLAALLFSLVPSAVCQSCTSSSTVGTDAWVYYDVFMIPYDTAVDFGHYSITLFPVTVPAAAVGQPVVSFSAVLDNFYKKYGPNDYYPDTVGNLAMGLYQDGGSNGYQLLAQSVNLQYNQATDGPYILSGAVSGSAVVPVPDVTTLYLAIAADVQFTLYCDGSSDGLSQFLEYDSSQPLPATLSFTAPVQGQNGALSFDYCTGAATQLCTEYGTATYNSLGSATLSPVNTDGALILFPASVPSWEAGAVVSSFNVILSSYANPVSQYTDMALALYSANGDGSFTLVAQSVNYLYTASTAGPYTVTLAAQSAATLPAAGAQLFLALASNGQFSTYVQGDGEYELEFYNYDPSTPLPSPFTPSSGTGLDYALAVDICAACLQFGTASYDSLDSASVYPVKNAGLLTLFPVSIPASSTGGVISSFNVVLNSYADPTSGPRSDLALALYSANDDGSVSLVVQSVNYVYDPSAAGPYTVTLVAQSAATLPAGAQLLLAIASNGQFSLYTGYTGDFEYDFYSYDPSTPLPGQFTPAYHYSDMDFALAVDICGGATPSTAAQASSSTGISSSSSALPTPTPSLSSSSSSALVLTPPPSCGGDYDVYGLPGFLDAEDATLNTIPGNLMIIFSLNISSSSSAAGEIASAFSLIMGPTSDSTSANVAVALYTYNYDFTFSLLVQSVNLVYDASTAGPYTLTVPAAYAATLPAGDLFIAITSDASYGIYAIIDDYYDWKHFSYSPGTALPSTVEFDYYYYGLNYALAVDVCSTPPAPSPSSSSSSTGVAVQPPTLEGKNLIRNPGFESGSFSPYTLSGDCGGDAVVQGKGRAHGGRYFASLGQSGACSVSQSVTLSPGRSYYLSFWLANAAHGSNSFTVTASIAGQHSAPTVIVSEKHVQHQGYTQYTASIAAPAKGHRQLTLTFTSQDGGGSFRLDDLSLRMEQDST